MSLLKSYAFPGNISDSILAIGSNQIPYMRTEEFSNINLESEQMLLKLIGCKEGKTIIYTASGTGAMEAIITNYVATKKKALIIEGGSFGHRWVSLCDYYQINRYAYEVPFAQDIDYNNLEEVVAAEKPDVFLCQHHETSSGALFNLSKISEICKRYHVSLVVDVISTFLAEELDMDKLGIDICVTSSQKGLNIPPGLSIVFISSKLAGYSFHHAGYYFDFEENLRNLKRGQTPYSPATIIYLQLHKRLKQLIEEGKERNIEKVHERAIYFRSLCQENKWNIPAEVPSYAITGFYVNCNKDKIFRTLIDKYHTYIMPNAREGFFRVSHMGEQNEQDLKELAVHIHQIEFQ